MRKLAVAVFIVSTVTATVVRGGAVVENKVILPKKPDSYMEVRHIVVKGSNEEIGSALGEIGRKWLDIKLGQYAAPIFAEARRIYLGRNYPILLKRMRGVAKAYGVPPDGDTYVTSALWYDMAPFACSTAFFPAAFTTDGHSLFSRNCDFYITTMRDLVGMKSEPGDHGLFSRNYVMELYPDEGYPSIVVGSFDLMNGAFDGMNSKGLVVTLLADGDGPAIETPPAAGDDFAGLSYFQIARLLLDTCATVEEAKLSILNNKVYFVLDGAHYHIADRSGAAFIFETDKNYNVHFTDNDAKPQVMTNHAVYKYPDVDKLPAYPPKATYNTYYRYRRLHDFVSEHKGTFSPADAWKAMTVAYGHTSSTAEGAGRPRPLRTIWTLLYDLDDLSIEVKFYLKDGPKDPTTGDPTLVFSKPFGFRLAPHGKEKLEAPAPPDHRE